MKREFDELASEMTNLFLNLLRAELLRRDNLHSVPQSGGLPTTTWVPGEVVVDAYEVPVASEADPGEYIVVVGMYDARTGQRLVVTDANGVRLSDDRIILDGILLSR